MELKFEDGTCRCGCGKAVSKGSKFAPGHDAKLKGVLARYIVEHGDDAKMTVNGETMDATAVAYQVGSDKLGDKVLDMVEGLRNKPTRKPRAPREPKAKKGTEPEGTFGVAYVGDWRYAGTLSADGLTFSYRGRGGDGTDQSTDQWRDFEPVEPGDARLQDLAGPNDDWDYTGTPDDEPHYVGSAAD